MNIEQIALEVAEEMPCVANGITFETHGYVCYTKDELAEHTRRCLAKIGEGLEPVAEANMPYGRLDWLIGTSITVERMYDLSLKKAKLYATPHEAIIAGLKEKQ